MTFTIEPYMVESFEWGEKCYKIDGAICQHICKIKLGKSYFSGKDYSVELNLDGDDIDTVIKGIREYSIKTKDATHFECYEHQTRHFYRFCCFHYPYKPTATHLLTEMFQHIPYLR